MQIIQQILKCSSEILFILHYKQYTTIRNTNFSFFDSVDVTFIYLIRLLRFITEENI